MDKVLYQAQLSTNRYTGFIKTLFNAPYRVKKDLNNPFLNAKKKEVIFCILAGERTRKSLDLRFSFISYMYVATAVPKKVRNYFKILTKTFQVSWLLHSFPGRKAL
jgi:hypothetical protein